jgi:hypothetical protein
MTLDAQRIAALLDGRLSPTDAAALLAEVSRSDDALGVVLEAAAVLRECASGAWAGASTRRHLRRGVVVSPVVAPRS